MAFEHMEPFGYQPDSLRAGQICAVIANVNRPKGAKLRKATDFFRMDASDDDDGQRESPESMRAKAEMITMLYAQRGGA